MTKEEIEQRAAERFPYMSNDMPERVRTLSLRQAYITGYQQASGEGWVSVEDRLPEYGLCIVQYYNPSDKAKQPYVIPLWRGRMGWYYDNSEKEPAEGDTLKVTHWQPLPQPSTTI